MKSYDVTVKGSTTSIAYGVTSVVDSSNRFRTIFNVTNGNVQGDKKRPNPISFTKEFFTFVHGVDTVFTYSSAKPYTNIAYGIRDNNPPYPLLVPDLSFGALQDRCMEKIYDQIRGKSNLAVDLAEGHQTLRMLRNTLKLRSLLGEFFKEFVNPKNKRFMRLSKGQRRLDYLSSKWLEYRYGWQPLVYSIYDAMDTLGKTYVDRSIVPCKARASMSDVDNLVRGSGTYSDLRISEFGRLNKRCEVSIHFHLPPGLQIYDWTSLNPLGIAWELMPLSFVADWVLNVSQQLSLWENYFLFSSRFRDGYVTKGYRWDVSGTKTGSSTFPYQYWPNGTVMDGQYQQSRSYAYAYRATYKDRSVLLSLPLPHGLAIKVNFGSQRQLDAAGLIHQLVGRKLRF